MGHKESNQTNKQTAKKKFPQISKGENISFDCCQYFKKIDKMLIKSISTSHTYYP